MPVAGAVVVNIAAVIELAVAASWAAMRSGERISDTISTIAR